MTVVQDIGNEAICEKLQQLNVFQSTDLFLIFCPSAKLSTVWVLPKLCSSKWVELAKLWQ